MSTRNNLVLQLAQSLGTTKKDADDLLLKVVAAMRDQLSDEGQTVLPGLGRFKIVTRPARKGHNPKTGEPIDIPQRQVVKFGTFPSVSIE